ncbi:hypothetical protein COMA2_80037 [Candidatus Nitrospira nitrificans]|uniref:Uncharacterized protein n=1 Tax=Candidatus Nitrospira nitrificans TaxID=1742973 RepID=A0A0S4LS83_9BACT|nr:hypothetical protein COMA2_80037 [Candidatus Nitrospira nitrificans]
MELSSNRQKGEANMTCTRCGGFTIHDYFYGATDYFAWQCHGLRCVNCGSVTNIHPIEQTSGPRSASRLRRDRRKHTAVGTSAPGR